MKFDWKIVKLGDVCTIRRGSSPRPIKDYLNNYEGMPWVKIADATEANTRYINHTNEFIKMEGVSKSVIVNKGDLILSNSGTAGLPKFVNITACIHDGWQVFQSFNGIDKEFLYYFLLYIRSKLLHNAYDSTMKNLTLDMLREYKFLLPSISYQKYVARILSKIDEKIENNISINNNLEQQAQAIFTQEILALDKFPVGWTKGSLLDIAEYLNGLAMQKFRPKDNEVGLPVLKIKELRQGVCDESSDFCSSNIKTNYIIHDGDVVFSWSGSLMVDFWCGGISGLNQHLFKVSSQQYDKWFYYAWTNHHLQKFISIAEDKATTMGHIKREELAKSEVWIPSNDDYNRIGNILRPIYDLIIANRLENRKLALIRDELLPKFMSSELNHEEVSV